MLNRLIIYIGLFLMIFSLISCSENDKDKSNGKKELFIEGVSEDEIIVGMTGPFDEEPVNYIGNEMLEGAMTYIRNLNENGGINGRTISIKTYNDDLEAQNTMEKTLRLINKDRVLALFNYPTGYTASKIAPLLSDYEIPLIGVSSGDAVFRTNYKDYVFNVRASFEDEIEEMVEFLYETLEVSKVAILKQNNSYGDVRTNIAKETLAKYDLKPITIVSTSPEAEEMKTPANRIIEANPEIVMVFCGVAQGGLFINEAKKLNPNLYFYMTSEGFETAQFINRFIGITEEARQNIFITQVMPNPWEAHTDFLKNFHNLSHKYYPEYSLNYYRMEGYVNAMVLAKAIELTGEVLSRERLVNTLRGIHREKLTDSLVINYGENDNQALEKVYITTITNGIFDSAN